MNNIEKNKALLSYIQLLREQAKAVLVSPTQELQDMKAIYHLAKIESNRLAKEANRLEKLISQADMQELCDQREIEEQYQYHHDRVGDQREEQHLELMSKLG